MKESQKKVLIVSNRWLPRVGGAQIYSFNLALTLRMLGLSVEVLTTKTKKEGTHIEGCTFTEILCSDFLYEKFAIPHPIPLLSPIKIYRMIKNSVRNSDVVIINDRYYLISIISSMLAKKYHKKSILVLHTGIQEYKGLKKIFYKINNYIGKRIYKNSEIIFGVSKKAIDSVSQNYKINKKSYVINNLMFKKNNTKNKIKKFFTVLFVGRIIEDKGIFTLLEAAKKLSNKKINFLIIGGGNESSKLKKLIKSNNLKNISFLGEIKDQNKLKEYYSNSNLFVLLSKKQEGLSLSVLEAMFNSLPIIVSDKIPINPSGRNSFGYICNNEEIEKLVSAINEISSNKNLYFKMSKNAYNYAIKNFSYKDNLRKLKEVLLTNA